MTLKEFIKDLKTEMKHNGWQNKRVVFSDWRGTEMEYLSIYDGETNGGEEVIFIDVGQEDE
jgi:hypothetical protein